MAEANRVPKRAAEDALATFAVMWALAAVWHLLGNTTGAPGWAQGLLAVAVGAVLLAPGDPLRLAALGAAGLVTMWEEAPFLGNHWLLAGFVNLGIVAAALAGIARGRPRDRVDMADRLFPVARLCLLVFYAFAAFSKLNTAFFDRTVSCAVFYFEESTASIGLSGAQLGGAAWLQHLVIWATVVVELSVPVLLLWRRTRPAGVLVGLVFHALLALDHSHQFFDFSSVLFALFVLFLPATAGSWVVERVGSIRARLALRREDRPTHAHLALAAVPTVVGLFVALDVVTVSGAVSIGWWPWQAYAVLVVVATIRFLRQERLPATVRLAPHHALFAVIPLAVLFNGLTPYLELKTGYGWNMYANLRTVDGQTNHLLLPATLPLTDEQDELVHVLSTDDPGLRGYDEQGYALTWRQLRTYLADHPDVRITYRRGSKTVALARAADDPELVRPVPTWRDKVQLFRAVDLREPERCVPTWGPAR